MLLPPSPVPFELGRASADSVLRACIEMLRNGAPVRSKRALVSFGWRFWSVFNASFVKGGVLENVRFTVVKLIFWLETLPWLSSFSCSFLDSPILHALFRSGLIFWMLLDHFGSRMAPVWPPLVRKVFPHFVRQALVFVNVAPRASQGVPDGPQERPNGFKWVPNLTKNV